MLVRLMVAAFIVVGVVPAAIAQEGAITITLDKMARADRVAIQRGYSQADDRCFQAVLDRLKAPRIPKKDVYITFDDPDEPGISVTVADTDENYVCTEGEMRSYDMGEYVVLKSFVE